MSHARCFINIPNIRRRYYTPHIVTYHFHRIHHHCSTLGIVLPTIQGISYTSAVHPIIQRNQRKPTTAAHPHQCDLYIIRLFLVSARHASLGRAGGGAAYRQMIASLAWDGRSMTSWISSSWPSPPSTTSSATGLPTVSAGAINGHSLSWWQLASYALLTASCCINSGVWGALPVPRRPTSGCGQHHHEGSSWPRNRRQKSPSKTQPTHADSSPGEKKGQKKKKAAKCTEGQQQSRDSLPEEHSTEPKLTSPQAYPSCSIGAARRCRHDRGLREDRPRLSSLVEAPYSRG